MKKKIKAVFIVAASVMVLAQFIRPERENPLTDPRLSIRANQAIPREILATLERSCFDCHSNETRWPWYSAITPLNFLVTGDVMKARKRLNFSEWGKNKPVKQQGLLQMIDDQISLKEMPLPRYLYTHPGASLSDPDISAISEWAMSEQERLSELVAAGKKGDNEGGLRPTRSLP